MTVLEETAPPEDVVAELEEEWPSHYEIIKLTELNVDHKYQRALTSLADKIAENFIKARVGVLIVSRRPNGKNFVVDGQTRFRGAEKSGKVDELPCLVHEGMTLKDEARLFADLQRNRRNIATHERFKSDLVAGDAMAVDIARILKPFGLKVGGKAGEIKSPAALEAVWKKDHFVDETDPENPVVHGPDGTPLLERTIRVLQDAWGGQEDPRDVYAAEMLRGIGRFLQGEGVDDDRLMKRLQNTTPGKLKLRAGMLREGKGGGGHTSVYMADAILTEYTRRG